MKNFMLKNIARSLMLASVITCSAVGVTNAAGAGDQTGQQGDMSGQGGPIDKKAGAAGDKKSGTAPEPSSYRQSDGSASGKKDVADRQGTGSEGSTGVSKARDKNEEKEKMNRNVKDTVQRDQAHKLKPSEYDPPK